MQYESLFFCALFLTWVVEIPVLLFILKKIFLSKEKIYRIFIAGIFSSALTLPYLWFVFPISMNYNFYIVIGELAVVIAESAFYTFFFKMSLKKTLITSFTANLLSFLAGMIIL